MDDSSISTSAQIIPLPQSGVTDGETNIVRLPITDKEQAKKEKAWSALAKEARTEASFKNPIEILEFPILSEEDCGKVKDVVLSLKDQWIPRGDNSFWTIGASTYNDLMVHEEGHASYYEVAQKNNVIIEACFNPLLQGVRDIIGRLYKRECVDLPFAGLMGFHIFDSTSHKRKDEGGNIHTDEPFQRLLWVEPFANPFSFTLAISLTGDRGGLDYWDENNDYHYLPYKLGHMYIHNGRFPHRINFDDIPTDEKPRITLQGQGAVLLDTNRVAVYF